MSRTCNCRFSLPRRRRRTDAHARRIRRGRATRPSDLQFCPELAPGAGSPITHGQAPARVWLPINRSQLGSEIGRHRPALKSQTRHNRDNPQCAPESSRAIKGFVDSHPRHSFVPEGHGIIARCFNIVGELTQSHKSRQGRLTRLRAKTLVRASAVPAGTLSFGVPTQRRDVGLFSNVPPAQRRAVMASGGGDGSRRSPARAQLPAPRQRGSRAAPCLSFLC